MEKIKYQPRLIVEGRGRGVTRRITYGEMYLKIERGHF